MNDRLCDLSSLLVDAEQASNPAHSVVPAGASTVKKGRQDHELIDVEMGVMPTASRSMETFFRHVDAIQKDIQAVHHASRKIGEINNAAMRATVNREEQKLSQQTRQVVDETNKEAKRAKGTLELLKQETAKLQKEGSMKQSDLRIRENLCNTLTRKFIDEMKLYQAAQQKYKADIKRKATRQVQIIKPDATEEEVDAVMRSEGGRDALYQNAVLVGTTNDQIQTSYAKVAGKYQDVLLLEQSVAELHQMFLDMALLTEGQGELLDQIEYHVREAAENVEDGNVNIVVSIEHQKSIRKKQCWLILIVVVCLLIILMPFLRRSSGN